MARVSRAELEDWLRGIQAITDAALSRLDDRELLAEVLDRTRAILHADTAAVLLLDVSAGELIAAAAAGLEEEVRQGVRIPVGRGFAGRIAAYHRPVILDQVDLATVLNPILLAKGIRALMGVPLIAGGKVIGVMHVGSLTPREFTGEDVALLQLAAGRAAAAVAALMAQEDKIAAQALQRSLLPSALPAAGGAEMAVRYVPGAGVVGGDWSGLVLPGQLQHHRPHLAMRCRAPGAGWARPPRPPAADDVALPVQDRARSDDQPHRRQALRRHRPRKQRQPRPVRPCHPRLSARPLALSHRELMAQHKNLGVLPPPRPPRQAQQRHSTGDHQEHQLHACQAEDHPTPWAGAGPGSRRSAISTASGQVTQVYGTHNTRRRDSLMPSGFTTR